MKRKYLLKQPLKAALLARLMAKAVDLFIVCILAIFFYPMGVLLALGYIGIADSLPGGQSVGKKLMGFSVISLEDGTPCSFKQSVIRNLPILIPLGLSIVPIWGWIMSAIIGIPLIVLELYLLAKLDSGHRLGDVMADTSVMAHDGTSEAIKRRKSSWFDEKRAQPTP